MSRAGVRRFGIAAPALRIAAAVAAFLLGIYGLDAAYRMNGLPSSLSDETFRSLQMILGRFPEALEGRPLPISLQIARWALPLLTGWATAQLAWSELRDPLRRRLNARRGNHLVIAGDEGLAARIALAERKAGHPVTIWADDARDRWVTDAAAAGAASAAGPSAIDALGLDRAARVVLVGADDTANLALAHAVLDRVAGARAAGDPLPLIVRVDDPDMRASLEDRFTAGERRTATIRFVSVPEIVARQVFLIGPLDRFVHAPDEARRLFVLGFSPTAERLVTRLLAGLHYADGRKPEIIVADADAALRRDVFLARRPGAAALAPVQFETAHADQPAMAPALIERLVERFGPANAILVDPADPARALSIALAIESWFRTRGEASPPIFTRAATRQPELRAAIIPFGALDTLNDPELLLQTELDTLARAIHDFYLEGRLDAGDRIGSRLSMHEWEMLPESVRDENRLVADCYAIKLRDIGAAIVPGSGDGLSFEPGELEELAHAEHDRWMAAKLLDGWRHGDARDDANRLHPDIIPYDQLSDPIKELDREQIRIMTRLLARNGAHVARLLMVAVDPAGSDLASGMADAVEALSRRYPDRAIRLLGDFADPKARAALVAARMPMEFLVAGNAEALLEGATDRAAARKLLATADCLHAVPEVDRAALLARAGARIAGPSAPPCDLPEVIVR